MATKQQDGIRRKHVPQRTCIACRTTGAKRGLVRIVRAADGRVSLDSTGKKAGRGAYLCHRASCWEQALQRNGLVRALRLTSLHSDDYAALQGVAATLAAEATNEESQQITGE